MAYSPAQQHTPGGAPLDAWRALCAREFAGLTQREMAERMTESTGRPWSEVMVRKLEAGDKRMTTAIARSVCAVTGYPWAWFNVDAGGSVTVR